MFTKRNVPLKLTSDASKKMTIGNVRMGLKSWSGESLASSRSRISSRTIFFLLNFSPIYDFVDSSTLDNSSNSVEKRTRFRNEINWSRPCDYCTDFGELPASQVKGQPDSRHHTEGSIFFTTNEATNTGDGESKFWGHNKNASPDTLRLNNISSSGQN